jgi:hypothetical protein
LIVLRGAVYGPAVPLEQQQACCKLALNSGTDLLGVDLFQDEDGGLTFAHATPFPDLTLGGPDLIRDLKRALEGDGP